MKRQIDIIFATHNGQGTLDRMLTAMLELDPPLRPWRILAVDNASNDDTPALLKPWSLRLPIEVYSWSVPGKLGALSTLADRIEGDLVVFVDDDIIPDAGWLRAYERAADANADADIFGGSIFPHPIEETGLWYGSVGRFMSDLFSCTTAEDGPVTGADQIYGPNMMLRHPAAREALTSSGVLGPTFVETNGKRVFPLGDESRMIERLEKKGARAIFAPEASLKHMVRGFQTELGFMLQRAQNHGRGVALRALDGRKNWWPRALIAGSSLLRAVWIWPRTALLNLSTPATPAFEHLYGLNWHTGRVKGALFGPFDPAI